MRVQSFIAFRQGDVPIEILIPSFGQGSDHRGDYFVDIKSATSSYLLFQKMGHDMAIDY